MTRNDIPTRMRSETVTIAPASSVDSYHSVTAGTALSHKARISHGRQLVQTQAGETSISTTQVYISGDATVDFDSVITLPDGSTPDIVGIAKPRRADGSIHHTKIMLE